MNSFSKKKNTATVLKYILSAAIIFISAPATAKSDKKLTYKFSQIWNATVRLIRVDLKYSIEEKDKEEGYLLFMYKDGEKKCNATIELIPGIREGKKIVQVSLNISMMPSYVEYLFLSKLSDKLKNDYGSPPTAVIAPPAPDKTVINNYKKNTPVNNNDSGDSEKQSEEKTND